MEPKAAYTVREFCEAHGISAGAYYEAKREGRGPREMRIGSRGVRVSKEAAEEWRREMEALAAAESAPTNEEAA